MHKYNYDNLEESQSKLRKDAESLIIECDTLIEYHQTSLHLEPVFWHLFTMSVNCFKDMSQLLSPNLQRYRFSPGYFASYREILDNFIDYGFLHAKPSYIPQKIRLHKR